MTSHTQGEWTIHRTRTGNYKIMAGPKAICSDNGVSTKEHNEYVPNDQRRMNFAMLSQAPKLLSCLSIALDMIDEVGLHNFDELSLDLVLEMRKTIIKATNPHFKEVIPEKYEPHPAI